LHAECPNARLFIVGGGEDFFDLQDKAGLLNLGSAVVFTGRIDPQQVPAYYAACDVIVDPVEDNLVGKTRLPIKLFESWAAGTPFITGDVGDRARVMGQPPAGILVPPGDPQALAAAIRKLLDIPELRQAILTAAQARLQHYTWQKIAADMEAFYLALTSQ
jgi:glycosyltransferase involved in cell wall biosynthesis